MRSPLPILLLLLSPGALLADEVFLRGGGSVSGEIVARDETEVKVDVGAGRITVKMASVERIDEGPSPLSEFRDRAAALAPADVEGWRALGHWAAREGLAVQAREAYSQVLKVLPDDPEANEAFGRILYQGRWVSEEEAYSAQGYVEVEGEWMTPQDRQFIVEERHAQEAVERQESDAQIRADEEAWAERQAAKEAEREQFWIDREIPAGGVVYWDWGVAPVVQGSVW